MMFMFKVLSAFGYVYTHYKVTPSLRNIQTFTPIFFDEIQKMQTRRVQQQMQS